MKAEAAKATPETNLGKRNLFTGSGTVESYMKEYERLPNIRFPLIACVRTWAFPVAPSRQAKRGEGKGEKHENSTTP